MDDLENVGSAVNGLAATIMSIVVLVVPGLIAQDKPLIDAIPIIAVGVVVAVAWFLLLPHLMGWAGEDDRH